MFEFLKVITDASDRVKVVLCGDRRYQQIRETFMFPEAIDFLGSESWDLVNFTASDSGYVYVFKRPFGGGE